MRLIQRRYKTFGFTLLELMLVMTLVLSLMVLGGRGYVRHVEQSKVLQAQSDLLLLASKLEHYKMFNLDYNGAAGSQISPTNTGKSWLFISYSPSTGSEQSSIYTLSISHVSENGQEYELTAAPRILSSGLTNLGMLVYYSNGKRGYDKNLDGEVSADESCWQC